VFRDRLIRREGGENVHQPEEINLEVRLTHRPPHEDGIEVAGIKEGGVNIPEILEYLPPEIDDAVV